MPKSILSRTNSVINMGSIGVEIQPLSNRCNADPATPLKIVRISDELLEAVVQRLRKLEILYRLTVNMENEIKSALIKKKFYVFFIPRSVYVCRRKRTRM